MVRKFQFGGVVASPRRRLTFVKIYGLLAHGIVKFAGYYYSTM